MIVVTAPTSMIGRQVLDHVLKGHEEVRVVVRDPSKLHVDLRHKVQVVVGSHGDPAVIDQALRGANAVFWLLPPDPRAESVSAAYLDFTRPAAMSLRANGVKNVVGVSALGRGTAVAGRAGYVTASLAMDDMIAGTGTNYRALTMPSFMDNLLRQTASIRNQGMFFSPISEDRKTPTCATRDIARVAATLLTDRDWTGVEERPVLGPEDLSFADMAGIMSDVLGKTVRFRRVSGEAYKSRLMDLGMSDAMAQGMLDMATAKDEGLDNGVGRTSGFSTPTSFREWCQDTLKPELLKRAA